MSWNAPIPSETVAQTLTRALSAAQVAVKLDAADQDALAIVQAYQRSIVLLEEVIRRESSEEETTRLMAIRTSYRERVQVLLLGRSVPIPRQSTETLVDYNKPWKKGCSRRASKARRWTVDHLKTLCGCADGSVVI
ncbi:hypothetical protein C8R43DRAFT_1038124 [Mycena crocata]|nr:hypothetical protein C8R43DRAFT_1038124 [Mycena crocata]